jgi:hypothetical protein
LEILRLLFEHSVVEFQRGEVIPGEPGALGVLCQAGPDGKTRRQRGDDDPA